MQSSSFNRRAAFVFWRELLDCCMAGTSGPIAWRDISRVMFRGFSVKIRKSPPVAHAGAENASKMAADGVPKKVLQGIPDQKELLRPLIFPNSQRAFKLFNSAVGIGITVYFVFFYQFRQEDHCFMPIRRFVDRHKGVFLQISPEDEEYVKKRTDELTAKS